MNEPTSTDGWTLSDEREFMENLLCQRFDFFLVVFSLILTAAFSANNPRAQSYVLTIGTVLSVLVWMTIYRAHVKHHYIMDTLYAQAGHPAKLVNDATRDQIRRPLFRVSRLIGVVIPWLCIAALACLSILSWKGQFLPT